VTFTRRGFLQVALLSTSRVILGAVPSCQQLEYLPGMGLIEYPLDNLGKDYVLTIQEFIALSGYALEDLEDPEEIDG